MGAFNVIVFNFLMISLLWFRRAENFSTHYLYFIPFVDVSGLVTVRSHGLHRPSRLVITWAPRSPHMLWTQSGGWYSLNPNQAVIVPTADPASTSKPWFLKSKYRVPATKMARPSGIYGNGSKYAGEAATVFVDDWRSAGRAGLGMHGSAASSFCGDVSRD